MRRTIARWAVGLAVVAGAALGTTVALAATWEGANCDETGSQSISTWKRTQASDYAQPPVQEGYEYGGGCYKLNDRDDTPLLPADAGGEGTDCSGFVFRVWALRLDGTSGFRTWNYDTDVHGPFATFDYFDPETSNPFKTISKARTSTLPMDAFVWYRGSDDKHIALLYSQSTSSDLMIHAHTNSTGVEISEELYRQYSDVRAVSRKGWTPECYPKCPDPTAVRR
jgi:hypothetical protein